MPSKRRERTGNRDSGAVAVETGLVSLVLIVVMFGIIDASFLFKDYLAVSAAARSGARMAASEPRIQDFAEHSADQVTNALTSLLPANIQEVWVYKTTSATGSPPATCTSTAPNNCVPFTWNGTKLTTTAAANWPYGSQNACEGDALRDSVGVHVKYKHASPLGFFFKDMMLSESGVMWLEPSIVTPCKPPP